jgi:hypothetical protein
VDPPVITGARAEDIELILEALVLKSELSNNCDYVV